MKTIKFIAMMAAVVVVCGGALAGTNTTLTPSNYTEWCSGLTNWCNSVMSNVCAVGTNNYTNLTDDSIREAAEDGTICRVIGHLYQDVPWLHHINEADIRSMRKCGICGKVQVQRMVKWEDE